MSYLDRMPFSDVVAKSKVIISGATNTLITRVPWQPGSQKYYVVRKVTVDTAYGSGAVVTLWDQDLSSATPATRGNASTGALLTIATIAGASGYGYHATLGLNECPRQRFEAGITAQSTSPNTGITLELELH